MQLKTLGESLNAINSVQAVLNNTSLVGEAQNIALGNSLKGYSMSAVQAAIVQQNLNKEQIKAILTENGYQGELLETLTDQLANTASTTAMATSQRVATSSTTKLSLAFKGLGNSIKEATLAHPVLALIATLSALGIIAKKVYDSTIITTEKAKSTLADSTSSFDSITSELKNIEDKLNDNVAKITELNSLPSLTYLEKDELEKLQLATKELELQYNYKKLEATDKASETVKNNKTAFDLEFNDPSFSMDDVNNLLAENSDNIPFLAFKEKDLEGMVAYKLLYKENADNIAADDKEWIDSINENSKKLDEELKIKLKTLQEYRNNLNKVMNYRNLDEDEQEFYDNIVNGQKLIYSIIAPNEWNQMEFNDVFRTDGIEKTKEELIELTNTGKLTPELISTFTNLNNAIQKCDFIPDDQNQNVTEAFWNNIIALADRAQVESNNLTYSFEAILSKNKNNISDTLNTFQTLQYALDKLDNNNLTPDDFNDLIYKVPELAKHIDISSVSYDNLYDNIVSLGKVNIENLIKSLRSLKPATIEDKLAIDNYITSLEVISGILPNLTMAETFNIYDEVEAKMSKLKNLQNDLGNSYMLTADKLRTYGEVFPELLALGTINSQGIMEINAQTAQSFIQNKEKEINADRLARIEELKNQRVVLIAKLKAAEEELKGIQDGSITASEILAQKNDTIANSDADSKETMGKNAEEYDRVVSETAENADYNLSGSINEAALNVAKSAINMIDSLYQVGKQAQNTQEAIAKIGTNEPIKLAKFAVDSVDDVVNIFQTNSPVNPFQKLIANTKDNINEFEVLQQRAAALNVQIATTKSALKLNTEQTNLLESQNSSLQTDTNEISKSAGSSSNTDSSKFDWIEYHDKLASKSRQILEDQLSDTYIAYTGLSKTEIDRTTELMHIPQLSKEGWDELIALADKAGLSLTELTERIKNGSGLESRQSILQQLIEDDKFELEAYKKAADQYKIAYEEIISKIPTYRDKIENGGGEIEILSPHTAAQVNAAIEMFGKLNDVNQNINNTTTRLKDNTQKYLSQEIDSLDAKNDSLKRNNDLLEDQANYIKASGNIIGIDIYNQQLENLEKQSNYYNHLVNRSKELLYALDPHDDTEKYNELTKQVDDYESARLQTLESIAQKEFEIAKLPIDNLDTIIGMYNDITSAIENWGSVYEASGKKLDSSYYQTLITNGATIIDHYKKQADAVRNLMGEYKEGNENWNDLYSKLQSINSEMSSMVQNLHQWNEALLQMPLDSIKEYSSTLQQALDGMTDLQSDYDAVLSAVTGAIQEQIDALQKENELTNDTYQNQIDALQEQLDLLDKANEARQYQLSVEQALYELEKARNQKTTRVIRDGQTTYESDSEAVRNAENSLADAQYELEKYNLQTKMDGLQEELDGINEAYDGQVEKLEKISEKWSEIKDNIETAKNEALAADYLGSGWKNTILNGDDTELYNLFKGLNESLSQQMTNYEEQINTTENISSLLENYITSYKEGTLSYDQAVAGIKDLLSQINEKMSAEDNLQNIYDYLGAVGGTSADAESILAAVQQSLTQTADELLKSMAQYNENSGMISEYTSSWQQLTDNVANMKDILENVRDNLADALEGRDDDDDSDSKVIQRHARAKDESEEISPGVLSLEPYHSGIMSGYVGSDPSKRDQKLGLLQSIMIHSLKPTEYPILAEKDEVLMTARQQNTLLDNIGRLYSPIVNFSSPDYSMINSAADHQGQETKIECNFGDITIEQCDSPNEFVEGIMNGGLRLALNQSISRRI